jgi:hypothetical protein
MRAVALCGVRSHVMVRQVLAVQGGLAGLSRDPVEGGLAQPRKGRVLRDQVGDTKELQAEPVAPLGGIVLHEARAAQQVEQAV